MERVGGDTAAHILTFLPIIEVILSAGHVCRSWRPIALRALAAWDGTLEIGLPAPADLVESILLRCRRIRGLRLPSAQRAPHAEHEKADVQLERLISRFSTTLTSLHIRNSISFPWESLLSALHSCSRLRQLDWPTATLRPGNPQGLLAGLPHLQELSIYAVSLSELTASPVAAQLTHLSIVCAQHGDSIESVCDLLAVAGALRSLQLRFFEETSRHRRHLLEHLVRLPALETLDLTFRPADIGPSSSSPSGSNPTPPASASPSAAAALEFPSLTSLSLQTVKHPDLTYTSFDWLEDLLPEFRAPTLCSLEMPLAASFEVLQRRFPGLRTLKVRGGDPYLLAERRGAEPAPAYLPHLERLTLYGGRLPGLRALLEGGSFAGVSSLTLFRPIGCTGSLEALGAPGVPPAAASEAVPLLRPLLPNLQQLKVHASRL